MKLPNRVTVYVPDYLKRKMERYPKANWSKLAQDAFRVHVEQQEKKEQIELEMLNEYGPKI
jgi:hypothetical protein